MKFYVISIILTVLVLFIPVAQKAAADSGENTIAVSLGNMETISGDEGSSSLEPAGGGGGSGGKPRTEEKQAVKQQEKIVNNTQIKETGKTVSANNQKSSVSETVSDRGNKTPKSALVSSNGSVNSSPEKNSGTGNGTGNGNRNGNGTETGTGNGTENGSQPAKTYGCVKGKGYKMISNPKIKLNKAQTLSIPSGTRVTVSASFTANGSLNISGVSGGNAEAQKLVRNAAGGIRVNVMDKTITKCNVTVIYTLAE